TYPDAGADLSAFLRHDGEAERLDLLVPGARCAACLAKIEREVAADPAVANARLNLTTHKLAVTFRPGKADPARIVRRLDRLGYAATPFDPAKAATERDREGRRLILALAVAGFGAMNTMMFSVPLWAGLFGQELGPGSRTLMMWLSGAVALPCALFAGLPFFQSAWRSLRAGRANMDVPISVGVLLTLGVSIQETLLHGRDAYFDAAVSLLFLLLVGRWLDHRLRLRAQGAAADLLALQAAPATRFNDLGQPVSVPVAELRVGDLLLVRPGDRIPVDARIEDGASDLDASLLTGETAPQPVRPGQEVRAGALNLGGTLTLQALASAEDSTLAGLARLVEAGAQSRSRYVRLADRAAALYVPVVHTLAAATFLGAWALGLGPREAIIRAVAVLIITCPCALGLAVPAVQITASARLFRKGVLVKSGAALERLAEVRHVVFDKTGVLTEGQPTLLDADSPVLAQAAQLARASHHPLAQALARAAGDGPVAASAHEVSGQGVEGRIDGRQARLGRAAFVGAAPEGPTSETELWFAFDGDAAHRLRFSDRLRPDAAATIAALRARGLSIEILSGDAEGPVAAVAATLGVTQWRAGVTPEAKAEVIKGLANFGVKALMVGDGLNDTAALSLAHCAMAPGAALDAAQSAADLVFSGKNLRAVVEAYDIARSARTLALENFGLSAAYNAVAAPAAMLGLINPFIAALAMSGSSLAVTLNALRTGA
ncbi:MAG: cadmium-translocating P-type ATPase, partial [Proteobacteria bacterium]|nr:cadmium-translocating P-type ATPase [Pseudomonadota bacterium]